MVLVVCILLCLGLAESMVRLDPLVDAPAGLIKGLTADDGSYSMFLGIPFGQIGANPFGVSKPYPKFNETYNAYEDSPTCPQMWLGSAMGSLDCLRINVFVPSSASSRNKLPVLVWIYGGSFNSGFAKKEHYGPKYLLKYDIIFVSFNYRIGPYGFMCLDTPDVPGNQGLKDQLLALRWVNENIGSFGGDVNKITLMGESAGGTSVDFHLLSKHEKLFNNVIVQSAAAVKPQTIIDSDLTVPLKISEQLGFRTDEVSEALEFLVNVDPKLVVAAYNKQSISLRPCVEKVFEDVERFVHDYPSNLDVPKAKGMPILIGFNNNEGLARDATEPVGYFMKQSYLKDSLKYAFNYDDNFKPMEDLVRHFYFGDEELTENVKDKVLQFETDYFYAFASQWTAEKLLSQGAQNVYQYLFSYDGGKNYVKNKNNIKYKGAAHADEHGYLFDMDDNVIVNEFEHDELVSNRMRVLWTNFVKYGNPTPETSDLLPVKWIPITNDTINYLDIDSDISMKKRPFSDRMAFWELFIRANRKSLSGSHQNT